MLDLPEIPLRHFVVIGDRVLIRPEERGQTKAGLYLPVTVYEKEAIQSGEVIKVGPGYPLPAEYDDIYRDEKVRYIPLQVKEGDLAIYLQKHSHEIEYRKRKFVIVPQSAILLVIRKNLEEDE